MDSPGQPSRSGQFPATPTHTLPCRNTGNSLHTLQRTASRSGTPRHTPNLASSRVAERVQSHSLQATSYLQSFHESRKSSSKLFLLSKYASCSLQYLPAGEQIYLPQELDIRVGNVALNAWKHGQLASAQAFLSVELSTSKHTAHHVVLASRALVRARLQQWDAALVDAEEVRIALLSHI